MAYCRENLAPGAVLGQVMAVGTCVATALHSIIPRAVGISVCCSSSCDRLTGLPLRQAPHRDSSDRPLISVISFGRVRRRV